MNALTVTMKLYIGTSTASSMFAARDRSVISTFRPCNL